jgi:hypothetical protein
VTWLARSLGIFWRHNALAARQWYRRPKKEEEMKRRQYVVFESDINI